MTHPIPSHSLTRSASLLPVSEDCSALATTLMFNSALRATELLQVNHPPDCRALMDEIVQSGHLLATNLLIPEAQVACQALQRQLPYSAARIRGAYRRGYWAELTQNQAPYFAFFEEWKTPDWILQSLHASCEQAAFVERIAGLAPTS